MATREHLIVLVTLMVLSPGIVSGQTPEESADDPFTGLCGEPTLPCIPGEKSGHGDDCKLFYVCDDNGDNFILKSCDSSRTFDTSSSKCRRTNINCATCPTAKTETDINNLRKSTVPESSAFKRESIAPESSAFKRAVDATEAWAAETDLLTDSAAPESSVSRRALAATEVDGSLNNGTEQSPTEAGELPEIDGGKVNTGDEETNATMAEVPVNATETGVPATPTDKEEMEETTESVMEEMTTSEDITTTIKTIPTTTTITMKPSPSTKTTPKKSISTSSTERPTEVVEVPSVTAEVKPPYVVEPEATTAANGTGAGVVGGGVQTGGLSPIMIAVIGGIVAGVILLIVVLIIVVCVIRKKKRRKGMSIPTIYNPQYKPKTAQTYRFSGDTNLLMNGRVHLHPTNSQDDDGEGAIVILSPKKSPAPPRPPPPGHGSVERPGKRKAPPPPNPFTGEVDKFPLGRKESVDYYEKERDKENNVELSTFGAVPPKKPPRTFSDSGDPIGEDEEEEQVFNTTDPLLTSVSNDNAYIPNGSSRAGGGAPSEEGEDDSDEDTAAEQEYGTQHSGFKPGHSTHGNEPPMAESYDEAKNPFFADDGESY